VPILAIALLSIPGIALAQHGGGRSQPGATSKPTICVHDCLEPKTGLNPDEDRRLQHLMAVQATPEQAASFNRLLLDVDAARTDLQTYIKRLPIPVAAMAPDATGFDQAIEKAHAGSLNFLASFSPEQKSGLKDLTRKVETADSDLDKQRAAFNRILQTLKTEAEPVATSATNLDAALANFQTQQFALAREMSIVLPSDGQDLDFPTTKVTITMGGQSITIPASGTASRTSVADGRGQFDLRVVADFSDLQQNVTPILRSLLENSPRCGERIEIQHASLHPQAPASLVVLRLHFERWICPGGASPMELASGDGTVEVKLTPSIVQNTGLHLASEFGRIDAEGLLRESLLTGSLGDTLREEITTPFLSAMQKGADLKATLPPAAQESAIIRKAEFQEAGAGQLSLVLEGQIQLSDEQTRQIAGQVKQPLSSQETSPP
jgi:hypothetical protein